MPLKIDLTGHHFGLWTVLYECPERKNNKICWHCKCECGNEKDLVGEVLRDGRSKSCGCLKNKIQKQAMIGETFGKLKVLQMIENERSKEGNFIWECQCECGNVLKVSTSNLKSGNTTSCGCTRKEKLIKYNHTKALDLKDQKFGLLTALYQNGVDNNKSIVWHCKCECGNECDVSSHDLKTGNTKSCGCQRNNSYGEKEIKELLERNNISFICEYTPKNFNTFKARFDFYLPIYNLLIEYDGIQHFQQGTGVFDNEEKFAITQEHDRIKNQWCKDNNIILIRIPYTHLEKLCIDDLLPETSQFIIE